MTPGFVLFDSQIGHCSIAWGDAGLLGVQLPEASEAATRSRMHRRFPDLAESDEHGVPPSVKDIMKRMRRMLAGHADSLLDVELDMRDAPPFHQRVWALTRTIPFGQTLTYGEVARRLGEPGAARAVGQALGRNQFAPIVPCHRVVAAHGRMGGFSASGGAHTKRRMLLTEGGLPDATPGLFDAEESGRIGSLRRVHERRVQAGVLSVAFEESGDPDGEAVILMHGFPYDARAFDEVAQKLAVAGCRVLVPYLRGYGGTRFLDDATPRSGQQAVLGQDLLEFMDALHIDQAVLAGFDWGGRACCIVAALWPQRVRGLVTVGGYNVQHIASSATPAIPEAESRFWYQYYLHGERGRAGLARYRREFCRLLWRQWSPNWRFQDATFERTAASFDNPDFVEVVVHSYRHRYALVAGDPAVDDLEARLARRPPIAVPTIHLEGEADGVLPPAGTEGHARYFTGQYQRRVIPLAGHNPAQETPAEFAAAVLELL